MLTSPVINGGFAVLLYAPSAERGIIKTRESQPWLYLYEYGVGSNANSYRELCEKVKSFSACTIVASFTLETTQGASGADVFILKNNPGQILRSDFWYKNANIGSGNPFGVSRIEGTQFSFQINGGLMIVRPNVFGGKYTPDATATLEKRFCSLCRWHICKLGEKTELVCIDVKPFDPKRLKICVCKIWETEYGTEYRFGNRIVKFSVAHPFTTEELEDIDRKSSSGQSCYHIFCNQGTYKIGSSGEFLCACCFPVEKYLKIEEMIAVEAITENKFIPPCYPINSICRVEYNEEEKCDIRGICQPFLPWTFNYVYGKKIEFCILTREQYEGSIEKEVFEFYPKYCEEEDKCSYWITKKTCNCYITEENIPKVADTTACYEVMPNPFDRTNTQFPAGWQNDILCGVFCIPSRDWEKWEKSCVYPTSEAIKNSRPFIQTVEGLYMTLTCSDAKRGVLVMLEASLSNGSNAGYNWGIAPFDMSSLGLSAGTVDASGGSVSMPQEQGQSVILHSRFLSGLPEKTEILCFCNENQTENTESRDKDGNIICAIRYCRDCRLSFKVGGAQMSKVYLETPCNGKFVVSTPIAAIWFDEVAGLVSVHQLTSGVISVSPSINLGVNTEITPCVDKTQWGSVSYSDSTENLGEAMCSQIKPKTEAAIENQNFSIMEEWDLLDAIG